MSEWTIATLKEYVDQGFINVDKKFESQDKAVNVGMIAQRTAIDAALASQKEAVVKAEIATEHRFASVNEFREQSAMQQATYVTIAEFRAEIRAIKASNDSMLLSIRTAYEASISSLQTSTAELKERLSRSDGRGAGLKDVWGYIIGAAAIGGFLIKIFFP